MLRPFHALAISLSLGSAALGGCSKEETKAPPTHNGVALGSSQDREIFRKALNDSSWQWNATAPMTLRADGMVINSEWDSNGLVTRWVPIDRRTLLLTLEKGRENNRLAVLIFAEDIQSFVGFDFDGGPLRLSPKK